MAITLPKASPAIGGTGGRRRGARLADAGDVPQVRAASDPGLNVPDFARFAGGIGDVGKAVGDVVEAGVRIQNRSDTISSLRIQDETGQALNDLFVNAQSEQDMSDENVLKSLNEQARVITEQAAKSGSGMLPNSQVRLTERLEGLRARFVNNAGREHLNSVNIRLDGVVSQETGAGRAAVRANPAMLDQKREEIRVFFRENASAFPEVKADALIRQADAEYTVAAVETLVEKEQYETARSLVLERAGSLSLAQQNRAFGLINTLEKEGPARIASRAEVANMGLPNNAIVTMKGDGVVKIQFAPQNDPDKRTEQIADIERQLLKNKPEMTPEDAHDRAVNLVDGNIEIEVVPGLGVVRETNAVDGTAREVPLEQLPQPARPPQDRTLFELAGGGDIAGLVPAAQELAGQTLGQISDVFVSEELTQARQEVVGTQNELIRALSLNKRFPALEIKRIQSEIKIAPSVWDSKKSLQSRMRGIDKVMRRRLFNEQRAAANVNLSVDARGEASQAANDISNFIDLLGVPRDAPPEGVPEASTLIGKTRSGAEVWQSPDGKKWVNE